MHRTEDVILINLIFLRRMIGELSINPPSTQEEIPPDFIALNAQTNA